MATKSFREDLRRARLEAISAPKPAPKPQTKPVEIKPAFEFDAKSTKTKKEVG